MRCNGGPIPTSAMPTKFNPTNPQLAINGVVYDVDRGADGKVYVAQDRAAGTEPGIIVYNPDGSVAWNSLTVSNTMTNNSGTDILRQVQGVAVSPDQKWMAMILTGSYVAVTPLINGIPDLTNVRVVNTGTEIGNGRDIAFDAADNIHYVSSGQGLYRVISVGGPSLYTTAWNGTSYSFTSGARSLYWDTNGTALGAGGATPSGMWDGVTSNFNTDASGGAGGTFTATPGSLDTVTFAAGTDGGGAYAVTVSGTQSAAQVSIARGNISFTGGSLTVGQFDIANGSTVTVSSTLNGGSDGSFLQTNSGSLILAAANAMTGTINLNGGTLVVQANGALGTASDNGIAAATVENGSTSNTIAFQGGINYTSKEWLVTNGGNNPAGSSSLGLGNLGVLANISGNNTFAGSIGFGNAGSGAGTGLNQVNIVAGSLEIDGMLTRYQGTGTNTVRTIDKRVRGDLVISGNNLAAIPNASMTTFIADSQMQINQGRVVLRSQAGDPTNTGNLPTQIDVTVASGAALVLDNSNGINTNRLASSNVISLPSVGSELVGVGNTAGGILNVPTLHVGSYGTVTMQAAASGVSELDLPGFDSTTARINRSTVLLRGIGGPNGTIKFLTAPATYGNGGGTGSTQISILPSAIGDTSTSGSGTDFVTLDGSGNARPLTSGEYKVLASGNAANDNTIASGTVNLSAAVTQVNSVKMSGATTLSIGSGKQLYVFSGAVLGGSANSSVTGGNLAFQQNYPAGVYDDQNPGNTTAGAYATDPFQGHADGITDGAIPTSIHEAVITVPSGATLVQDASNVISGARSHQVRRGNAPTLWKQYIRRVEPISITMAIPPRPSRPSPACSPLTPDALSSMSTPTLVIPRPPSSSTAAHSPLCQPAAAAATSPLIQQSATPSKWEPAPAIPLPASSRQCIDQNRPRHPRPHQHR